MHDMNNSNLWNQKYVDQHFIRDHSNSFLETESSMNMKDNLTMDSRSLTSVLGRIGRYSSPEVLSLNSLVLTATSIWKCCGISVSNYNYAKQDLNAWHLHPTELKILDNA